MFRATDVHKMKMHVVFPSYFGNQPEKFKKKSKSMLTKFYSYKNFKIILKNTHTIGPMFQLKNIIPMCCQSLVVYEYNIASCDASYVVSTKHALHCRIEQNAGRS